MAWTYTRGPFGLYRVGRMEGKTFVPIGGFLTAAEADRAVTNLNNPTVWVPPPPLPLPPEASQPPSIVKAVRVQAKVKR